MIHTPRQLKALVRNLSKGNSAKAQMIIRTYVMERFLERLSRSRYRNNLILKGGTLVAAMVGLDNRSTMDVDTTVKGVDLSAESIRKIVDEIASIEIEDGMAFEIKSIEPIMDESDYPGIRVMMDAMLETMQTPLKLDFSTGDAITPSEIAYSFKLMFEDRTISILAYNLETILAEKLETLLSRGTANTRMRDFYDIFALEDSQMHAISEETLRSAFDATLKKRGSTAVAADANLILSEVETDAGLMMLWSRYQRKFDYAADIRWEMVMGAIKRLTAIAIHQN
ncbi:nucleotidyl transferase AbiEii/AbiGii toxin family protein [Bacillota bacterium Meth-B3]